MKREELREKIMVLIDQCVAEAEQRARIDTLNKVYQLSPTALFKDWKPTEGLKFYERLKAYEQELSKAKP